MKPGKQIDGTLTENIIDIIKEHNGLITPEMIRREHKEKHDRLLSWITVRRHLDILLKQNRIDETIISTINNRTLAGYFIGK